MRRLVAGRAAGDGGLLVGAAAGAGDAGRGRRGGSRGSPGDDRPGRADHGLGHVLEPRRPGGDDDLGCVRIEIPSEFDVGSVTVTDEPAGTDWSASIERQHHGHDPGVERRRSARCRDAERVGHDRDRRHGDGTPTSSTGTADAFDSQDCDDAVRRPDDPGGHGQGDSRPRRPRRPRRPTPTPTPTPTPVPTPTPDAGPDARPRRRRRTPAPTPTPDPAPPRRRRSRRRHPHRAPRPPRPRHRRRHDAIPTAGAGPGPTGRPGSTAGGAARRAAVRRRHRPTAPTLDGTQPGARIEMPGVDGSRSRRSPGRPPRRSRLPFGNDFQWVVPGLVLTFPGILLVLVVVAAGGRCPGLGADRAAPARRRRPARPTGALAGGPAGRRLIVVTTPPDPVPIPAWAGLCASCGHARPVVSGRGSVFVLCERSPTRTCDTAATRCSPSCAATGIRRPAASA